MDTEEPAVFANANLAIITKQSPFLFIPTRWNKNLTVTRGKPMSAIQQARETYVMPIQSTNNKATRLARTVLTTN